MGDPMLDLQNKTYAELQALIAEAQQQLVEKQKTMRKEVMAQIKELAASIGATVEIKFDQQTERSGERKRGGQTGKVAAKYQNPSNPEETWTGRGVAPKWMQELLDSGRNKDEFLIDKGQ
jgi:DNA-binding protein H-NS